MEHRHLRVDDVRIVMIPGAIDALLHSEGCQRDMDRRAANVERYQKTHCAVDTGAMKASIHVEKKGTGRRIGTSINYGIYVELGTRRMRAQPFIRPSVDAARL